MERNDHELRALSIAGASRRDHELRSVASLALRTIRSLMGASAPEPGSAAWRVFSDRLTLALDDARVDRPRLFTDALRATLQQVCAEAIAHDLTALRSGRLVTLLRYGGRPLETEGDQRLLATLMRVTWPDSLLSRDGPLPPSQREEFLAVLSNSGTAREVIRDGLNADCAVNLLMLKAVVGELQSDERYAGSPTAVLCRLLADEAELAADSAEAQEPLDRPRG